MRSGSAGRGEEGRKKEEATGAFAQGTDRCVYVPLQGTSYCTYKRSALHYASSSGLESIVAKLLSLGANAALKDAVRACSYMNTCMCISPYVFIRMKGSCSNLYPSLHLCIYMHSARALTRARSHAYMKTCTYTHLMSERELRHEDPHPSEVYMREYSHKHTLHIFRHILHIVYMTQMYTHALMCIHAHTCRTG